MALTMFRFLKGLIMPTELQKLRAEYDRLAAAVKRSTRDSAEWKSLMAQKRGAFVAWYDMDLAVKRGRVQEHKPVAEVEVPVTPTAEVTPLVDAEPDCKDAPGPVVDPLPSPPSRRGRRGYASGRNHD